LTIALYFGKKSKSGLLIKK